MPVRFVPPEIVPILHHDLIKRYGGRQGLRDIRLLDSALAQPKMTVGSKHVHRTLFDKAAAYGFHISRNHPFIDGNKRVAFVIMDIFLQINGWEIVASEKEAYSMMIDLVGGNLSKTALSQWLRKHSTRLIK